MTVIILYCHIIKGYYMKYTDTQKKLMIKVAIEAIEKLEASEEFKDRSPKSFKNSVWAVQAMRDGRTPNNPTDELALKILKEQ